MTSQLRRLWDLVTPPIVSAWRWTVTLFKTISVEPAYLIFAISQGLYLIVSAELYIDKVCKVNLNYSEEICENLYKDEYDQQQTEGGTNCFGGCKKPHK